jgi:hypothetical protein
MLYLASSIAPTLYAAAGALGGAIVAGFANQLVARQQRTAELERLDRQLEHDRMLRQAEILSAAERLSAQLLHDRQLRDLEHVRNTFGPLVAQALKSPDLITRLRYQIRKYSETGNKDTKRKIGQLSKELDEASARHTRESVLLAGVIGLHPHSAAEGLHLAGALCGTAADIGRAWNNGQHDTSNVDEPLEELEALDDECGALLLTVALSLNRMEASEVGAPEAQAPEPA